MPPAHVHVACVEAFFVLEGEVTFILDGVEPREGPDSLLVPGGRHTRQPLGRASPAARDPLATSTTTSSRLEALWHGAEPPTVEEERR